MSDGALFNALRSAAQTTPESGIVRVWTHARNSGKPFIPLIAGEGHLPTPEFICTPTHDALTAGETFYTYQKGLPELRDALTAYHKRHFAVDLSADRFIVTGSGMQAIQLTIQALAGQGDEVVLPTPAWPNFSAALGVMGAKPVPVPMDFQNGVWSLDNEKLKSAITSKTRAIFINSPCNPTGWTAELEQLEDILKLAREKDVWIIADEVYSRFFYGNSQGRSSHRAASFYDLIDENDKVIFVNTFSKNWAMTGWRVGWISAPPQLGRVFENLVQYSTSGVSAFMQRGAIAALNEGDEFTSKMAQNCKIGRDILCDALAKCTGVRFERPKGAFYLFVGLDKYPNTSELGLQLVDDTGLVMAPGEAFGAAGAGFLRICFARDQTDLEVAAQRLTGWISKHN